MDSNDWRAVHVGFGNDGLAIDGAEIWKTKWRPTREPVLQLPHPAYPDQHHYFNVYVVDGPHGAVRFAAGELSNGVWGFYVPA